MKDHRFDDVIGKLPTLSPHLALAHVAAVAAVAAPITAARVGGAAGRKKGKMKPRRTGPACRPVDNAVVVSHGFRGAQVGSSRVNKPGQPFTPWHTGRLDRVDLTAGDQYALVVRFLGDGDDGNDFQTANTATCFDPGALLTKASKATTVMPFPDLNLDRTVYVVP